MTIVEERSPARRERPVEAVPASRRLDIQGLRAVAVLMVLAAHADLPVPGGFVGVDVFFVISGFVITAMLQREWQTHGRIRFGRFYVRRFKRLIPPLALLIVVTMVLAALVLPADGPQRTAAKTALGAVALSANLIIATRTSGGYFDAPAQMNPLLHTWSLSVEEQFYLLFPVLLAAGWALSRSARRRTVNWAVLIVGALALGSLALTMAGWAGWASHPSIGFVFGYYSPLTRTWEFALGALLALNSRRFMLPHRLRTVLAVVGGAAMIASLWLINEATPFPGPWTILPVLGTGLLLLVGSSGETPAGGLLSSRPMVKIGDWSYSIYLWHWPMIVFASFLWPGSPSAKVLAALASFVPAAASYRWVEEPLRRMKVDDAKRLFVVVLGTLLPPVLVTGAVVYASANNYWSDSVSSVQAKHWGADNGCFVKDAGALVDPGACLRWAEAPGAPVYLFGDSNADQFSEGLALAANEQSRPFLSYTYGNCLFADITVIDPETRAEKTSGCGDYKEASLQWLSTAPRGIVLLAATDTYLVKDSPVIGSDGQVVSEPGLKFDAYGRGLSRTIQRIQAAGHEVLLVKPIPNFRLAAGAGPDFVWGDPQQCTNVGLLLGTCATDDAIPISRFIEQQGDTWSTLEATAASSNALVVDLTSEICPDRECGAWRDGRPLYRDDMHISVGGSQDLAPAFEAALNRLAMTQTG